MLEKVIKYKDFDGNDREETFRFNLTEAEVVEMQYSEAGGLEKFIHNVVAAQDQPRLIKLFKDLVLRAYGEKSMDGRRFIKNQELRDGFSQTEAYSKLFMELATDADAAAKFVNGIMPSSLKEKAAKNNISEVKIDKGNE